MNSIQQFSKTLDEAGIRYLLHEKLSSHCTFKIGGECDIFVLPSDEAQLQTAVLSAHSQKIRYFVLGRGSNVLFDDNGYRGAVISTEKLTKIEINGDELYAECGAFVTRLASFCAEHSLCGLEFAYGIPGSVGGAVYMNAGAYGGQISDVLQESSYIDTDNNCKFGSFSKDEHDFAYRNSVYMHRNMIITSATFKLSHGNRDEIKSEMEEYMKRRRDKQPLEFPSAGSVFKRCEGHFTGQMIEESGLKGYSIGGAEISEKHAGFIINKGNATASDVLMLIDYIKGKIKENYALDLECEVIYVKENG